MRRWIPNTLACLALLVAVQACDSDPFSSGDGGDTSRVSVFLTDAPGDVAAVWVEVVEIYLQGGPDGRVVLLDEPTELIELTSLAGTAASLVTDEEVESANYGQLRFVIGGAVLETTDGRVFSKDGTEHPEGLETTGTLICPSCSQTGIKVTLRSEDLELNGADFDVLLDFDVTQSFGRQAGMSGNWVMNPVIHGVDMSSMGAITGTVALATDEAGEPTVSIPSCPGDTERGLADFVPTAVAINLTDDEGDPIVRSGFTKADGSFRIAALTADDYQLGYMGELTFDGGALVWTAEVDPSEVTVSEGGTVSGVEFTITGATCSIDG